MEHHYIGVFLQAVEGHFRVKNTCADHSAVEQQVVPVRDTAIGREWATHGGGHGSVRFFLNNRGGAGSAVDESDLAVLGASGRSDSLPTPNAGASTRAALIRKARRDHLPSVEGLPTAGLPVRSDCAIAKASMPIRNAIQM